MIVNFMQSEHFQSHTEKKVKVELKCLIGQRIRKI